MSDKIVETSTDKTNYGPNYIGNVIRILDEYTLIVNAGFSRLYKGDKIVVYTIVEPIIDLDGSVLSMYEYPKDVLEVVETNSNYSVCQKKDTKTVDSGVLGSLTLSPLFGVKEERIPLNVNKEDISPLKEVNPQIQIGDPIKLIRPRKK